MFSRLVKVVGIYGIQHQESVARRFFSRNSINSNSKTCNKFSHPWFFPICFAGFWGSSSINTEDSKSNLITKEILLAEADASFDQGHFEETLNLLQSHKNEDDVEILWRVSRALYNMSKLSKNSEESKKLVYEAYDLVSRALRLNEDHWAVHKWFAILLNSKTSYEGIKTKINELYNIKSHMLTASKLNPTDATTLYMIGNWCFQVADLSWYQRKIASAIFGEPPISNFEEALMYFEKAEQTDPNFYSHNLLMLGKTYLKLNKKDEAIRYLTKASEYPAKNDDDLQAKQEAIKILSSLR